jgi:4-oxalmesaconate hydratase
LIVDCHGHYTTAPKELELWREAQLAGNKTELKISDDQLRESLETNQFRILDERGTDVTFFSPRASHMGHHLGDAQISSDWARVCNDIIYRCTQLYPDRLASVAQLPQTPGAPPSIAIPEIERTVNELGFIGVNLNPDPSGGWWKDQPLFDRSWYPVYEKLVELDVPAMIHVSTSCNPNFHFTGAHYMAADTTAFMQLVTSDLFKDFPTLRFIIPHGGGAVPYHWGRYRGIAQDLKRPPLTELLKNVYFDTCVYHQPGIDLLLKVIPVENILVAGEIIGAVRGIDPETGFYYDDTKRYVDANTQITDAERQQIFEGNARKVFPRWKPKAA